MTKKDILNLIKEVEHANHAPVLTFYLRYTTANKVITCNTWGEMDKFEKYLKEAETSDDCIGDSLPVELLVLNTNICVHCWTKNPLWDPMIHPEEFSHIYTNVPLVGKYWFIDPEDWMDIDNRKKKAVNKHD